MKRKVVKIGLILIVLVLTFSCAFLTSCTKKKKVVTFSVDGAEYKTIATAGKESITMPDTPTKDGYTFGGWYEDEGVWSKAFTADSLKNVRLKSDVTVYAKWNPISDEAQKYTISYVGGENTTGTAPQVQNLVADTQITLPENPFVKEGYTFLGWSDGSQTYAVASSYTVPANNVIFTAIWSIIQFDVIFSVDGAEYHTIATAGKESITMPESPTKEGFNFVGWYEDEGVWSKPFIADSLKDIRMTSDVMVYAKWNPISDDAEKYTISYVGGENATGTAPQVQNLVADTQITLPENPFVKEGFTFLGWFDGSQTYAVASSYTVPENNVTFTATWQIIQVDVTFDIDGGVAITPLVLDYGSTLPLTQAPKAVKENVRFAGWYIDEEFTQPLSYGAYEFKQDTVLYAAYEDFAELAESTYYNQEDALIIEQPTDVSFTVISATPLTNDNLYTYVTLTSEKHTVPSLTVTNGEQEGQYVISPTQLYEEGGEYKISVKDGLMLTAQIRDDKIQVYAITFRIDESDKNIIEKSDKIIYIGLSDYYFYTSYSIGLKQQFVFDKSVKKGSILCISDVEGKQEHYKSGAITYKTVAEQSYYEVELLPCELYEVYDKLDVSFNKSATFSDDEIEYLASQSSVENALFNNADYQIYQGLVASALQDYAVSQGIVPVAKIENKSVTFSFERGEEGTADFADISITASFKITFSEKTYAMVTISATEKLIVDFTGHAKAFVDAFGLEGGSWYDIDLLTIMRSETTFNMNVILTNNGKTFNIKDDLAKLVNEFNPDSFVEMYKKNIKISGDQLTVINFQICRLRVPFETAEIGVPITFRTKLNVKAPFSCAITVIVEKGYTIKGTHQTELKREMEDRVTYYSIDFGSVGFIGVEVGVVVGVELSFINLSRAGVVGLEVDVGAYFDYHGYGQQKISGLYLFGIGKPKNSGNAIFHYVFGIYLNVNAYVRSELFSFDKTVGLYTQKFPLFDGGTQYVILGFDYDGEDKRIITNSTKINLKEEGLLNMVLFDLLKGETSIVTAEYEDIDVWAFRGISYDESTSDLSVGSYYVNNNKRLDQTLTIGYYGKHGDLSSYYLYNYVDFTYLPPELNIAPEDVDKVFDVEFKIDGVTIATRQVKIGDSIGGLGDVLKEAQEYDEYISCIFWSNKIAERVFEDLVFEPTSVFYVQGQITLEFMVKGGENSVGYRKYTFRENVGTKITDIISKLEDFEEVVGGVYRFTGWDGDVNATLPPFSYYENGKDLYYTATYEAIPFDYTIILGARYDINNNLVEDTRVITHTYVYGDLINYRDDEELQRLGYSLDLVGDNDVSYNTIQVAYYGPVVIRGTYSLRNDLTVKVYADYSETKVIYQENNVKYGADLSNLLTDTETIREYVENYDEITTFTTEQGFKYCRVFLGWANTQMLKSVTFDVRIYVLYETKALGSFTHKVRFDAMGGTFPSSMEHTAIDGIALAPNNSLDEEFLQTLEPTFKSNDPQDVGYEYVFVGWYDNADLTGDPYETISADTDKVMYAKYEKQAKDYTVRIIADGYLQLLQKEADGSITSMSEEVDGLFEGDAEQYELNELTYAVVVELVEDIENGTVDGAYPNFDKIPVSQNDAYTFSHWQVCVFDSVWECVPMYKEADNVVTINFHFGQGIGDNQSHIYSLIMELVENDSLELNFDKLFTPTLVDSQNVYDVATESWELISYCYEDDNYYYVPKSPMCWSKAENGAPISVDDYVGLTAVFNFDDEIKTYDFYALYDAVPKSRTLDFIIDTNELERWEPAQEHSWSVSHIRSYGSTLTEDMIPTAQKDIPDNEVPYEFEFSHWMRMYFDPAYPNSYAKLIASEITYTTQELLALDNAFEEDAIYKAVFAKKTRYVTVTFDAGETGYFASNNDRYRTITVPACVDVEFGETPLYEEVEGYYDYVFDNWSYVEPFSFQTGDMVTAYSRMVRNETPAPDTGIIVSWMEFSGDIGSIHTDIPGFFYYPDEGRVDVYGTGLTFSGEAEGIVFNIGSGNVTLENLTLTVNDREAIYLMPAYENNMSGLNRETEVPIKINVKGTVELKGAYTTLIGSSGNCEIHLNGIGQDAKLLINHDSHELENQEVRLTYLGDYLFINNLNVEVNAKINQTSSIWAFSLQSIYLTMTNSSITVNVEGSVLGESETYDNAYAFYVDPMYSDAVFLPDGFAESLVVTGCEKLFIDLPDYDEPVPFPAWEDTIA